MKKFLKIAGITVGIIVLLLLVLPFVFKDKIMGIVKDEANKMLNAKLDFEQLDLSFFRHFPQVSIELNGLNLTGKGDFENDTLVAAERIEGTVNIMSLFGDQGLDIRYIGLEKPVIRTIRLADGRVNWDILKNDPTTVSQTENSPSAPSTFSMKLDKVEIRNGQITYLDDSTQTILHIGDLNLKLKGDMSAKQSRLDCSLNAGEVYFTSGNTAYLKQADIGVEMKLDADFDQNKYTFDKNTVRLNAIEMNIDGWVALLKNGLDMDIKVNTPKIEFKDILSLIPALYQNNFNALKTSGKLALDAQAKGTLKGESLPAFEVKLDVSDARFKYDNLPNAVEQIHIAATASNPGGNADKTVVDISDLRFSLAGNPFKAALTVSTPLSDLTFKAMADGKINLNAVKKVYPLPDSINLNGVIAANLNFSGRMSDVEKEKYENIQGTGMLTVNDMTLKTKKFPEISISQASATVNPKALTLERLNLKVGESDLQANGSLNNYLPYLLKGDKLKGALNLSSNLLNVNELTSLTGGNTTQEVTADTSVMSVIEVPKNLELQLTARLKQILFQKMVLKNFAGDLTVRNGTVSMTSAKVDAFGGGIQARGSYSTAVSITAPEVQFALNIKQASFEETFKQSGVVQKMIPVFAKIGGNYSVDLDLKTPLDATMQPVLNALYAKGTLQSNDINLQKVEIFGQLADLLKNDKLKSIQVKDIKIPFLIENGLIKTNPFDLKMGNININLSGTTSLTQQINYIAQVNMPSGSQVGNIVSKVNVLIGGTFAKPEFKLDTKGLVEDALKQAINDKLGNTKIGELLGKNDEEQIANTRKQAEDAGKKLVEVAQKEGDKLVEKASNPIAKIAAKKAAEKLVKEAQKQADQLSQKAEEQVKQLQKK